MAQFASATELDYLRLYARVWMPARQIIYHARTQIVRFTWTPGGTQAFMLTRRGAERIMKAVAAAGRIIRPIDDFIDRYWEVKNPVYALFPSPLLEHCIPTLIHANEQVRARQQKQQELDRLAQSTGLPKRLQLRAAALGDRLVRRKVEKEMQRNEANVKARVQSYMQQPGFNHFKVPPAALSSAASVPPLPGQSSSNQN